MKIFVMPKKTLCTVQVLCVIGYSKSELPKPKKKTKKLPLTKEDKEKNQALASERVANENVIGMLKRFKIISDTYRNRRKRFGLRFNLISGIYNFELL